MAYGWSGGKDSQALSVVCEGAGVRRSLLGMARALEWPSFLKWIDQHAPPGLTTINNPRLTLEWLVENQRYLFPQTANDAAFWYNAVQRRAQRSFPADLQIYGRRKKDGNVAPKLFKGAGGVQVYNPIRDWSHEMVLAVIRYYDLPLPPIYDYPLGWIVGTNPWPGIRSPHHTIGWSHVWQCDPDVVRQAAEVIPSARRWIDEAKHQ